MNEIQIRGARTHNLANVNLDIPRDKLIVITGLSGSGKSSLAFDTIYAEGQRRYVESLSAYVRQFLPVMEKPDVDLIEGLSPTISIEQKSTSHNPRSTVGTITEIYDYLRLLFARLGEPHCPRHQIPLAAQTIRQMVDQILTRETGESIILLAPVVRDRKGEHVQLLEKIRVEGFIRVRIDGQIMELEHTPRLEAHKKHTIEVVVDRFKIRDDLALRLSESFETALRLSGGIVTAMNAEYTQTFSSLFACHKCGYSLPELEPRLFSFNNPAGACTDCNGLGIQQFFAPERIVQDKKLSLSGGAIRGWDRSNIHYYQLIRSLAKHYDFDPDGPFGDLPKKIQDILFYGSGDKKIKFAYLNARGGTVIREHPFEGILPNLQRRYHETDSISLREKLAKYQTTQPCPSCRGTRLNEAANHVHIMKRSLPDITKMTVIEAQSLFASMQFQGSRKEIAEKIIKEIKSRLHFLVNVGLDYLSLDRSAETLSGGEAQRIRLARQIGSGLVGVMYVLDEPSIGLHQRDNQRLLSTLFHLRDLGNTVIVVEHDEEAIKAADHVIDIGPGAGYHGGHVVATGTPKQIADNPNSLTGQYLQGTRRIALPVRPRRFDRKNMLILRGARGNNLQSVALHIPLGIFTCVSGVSGSGKSTLINDTLYRIAARELGRANTEPAPYETISGLQKLDKVIDIDQSPIGRTPRSNPATYTGLFTPIREIYAATQEARSRGYKPGRFSFNLKGGRCEDCQGDGVIKVEMHFLPDTYVPCDHCKGKRYSRETLEIDYKGKNIHEVLEMTVEEARIFFDPVPSIAHKLQTLVDVGLSYIHLGQNAVTLSGGEAQRIKLAKELSRRDTGKTLYILDEPTTGLHFHDIQHLLKVLQRLCEQGNTIVVIEHNLDVIKTADWVIDLGPEGGKAGGKIIATGTPKMLTKEEGSYTGQALKKILACEQAKIEAQQQDKLLSKSHT